MTGRPSSVGKLREIKNEDLTLRDIPEPSENFRWWVEFALTFNAYKFWGGDQMTCVDKANSIGDQYRQTHKLEYSLSDLRAALFLEERRMHWVDPEVPDPEYIEYIKALVKEIRQKAIRNELG